MSTTPMILPKEVVALLALGFLTCLPLGMNNVGILTVSDFLPGNDDSDLTGHQMEWIRDHGFENYFNFMSIVYILFASATTVQFIASIPPMSYLPDAPSIRSVLCLVWYISCVLFLRGCLVLFPVPERCGLGLWLGVPCIMVFTLMVFESPEAVAGRVDPALNPRVIIPSGTPKPTSPTKVVEPSPVEVEQVRGSAQQEPQEEDSGGRGRVRGRTSSRSSRGQSRGKSKGRSKSRGPAKSTRGKSRKKADEDF